MVAIFTELWGAEREKRRGMEAKGHGGEEEGVLGGKRILGGDGGGRGRLRRKWEKGVVGNSLRRRSLLSIQSCFEFNCNFEMSPIKHFCGINHPK